MHVSVRRTAFERIGVPGILSGSAWEEGRVPASGA